MPEVKKEVYVVWCPGDGDYEVLGELLGVFEKESDALECAEIYNRPFVKSGGWSHGVGKAEVSKQILQADEPKTKLVYDVFFSEQCQETVYIEVENQ